MKSRDAFTTPNPPRPHFQLRCAVPLRTHITQVPNFVCFAKTVNLARRASFFAQPSSAAPPVYRVLNEPRRYEYK